MTKTRVGVISVIVVAIAVLVSLALRPLFGDEPEVRMSPEVTNISPDTLTATANARVYFGHQSVGENVISGIRTVFAQGDVPAPEIVETTISPSADGGFFAHSHIGENGDPAGKMAAFEANMRSGLGDAVDVALMKFCYLDVTAATDVPAVFDQYSKAMANLEASKPDVKFLYTTVPLTTPQPGMKAKIKSLLGRDDPFGADNASRERYNQLIRAKYGESGRLLDIAAIESTRPDGTRVSTTEAGQTYYWLYGGYASDYGHLNESGSALAAANLMSLIAADTKS